MTTEDITQLMETIGPTTRVEIKYNTHGKPIGVAFVEYEFGRDAMEAIKRFDGRLAAGQTISVSSTMPLIDRIGGRGGRSRRRGGRATSAAASGNSNGSGSDGAAKPKRRERKTLEDLDNELNMYMSGEAGNTGETQVAEQPVPEQGSGAEPVPAVVQGDHNSSATATTVAAADVPQEAAPETGAEPANNDIAME